jgi:hypothetical protein
LPSCTATSISREAATQIEEAVRGIAGVRDIRSHLTH